MIISKSSTGRTLHIGNYSEKYGPLTSEEQDFIHRVLETFIYVIYTPDTTIDILNDIANNLIILHRLHMVEKEAADKEFEE